MRQAGILAAAGIEALGEMPPRLRQDHGNALRLARGISGIGGLEIDLSKVQTNIIYFRLNNDRITGGEFIDRLDAGGVKALETGPGTFRMVTHHGIEEEDIDRALDVIRDIILN